MPRNIFIMLFSFFLFISPASYAQTYSNIISDKTYTDFINDDILRDSIKVLHHIIRRMIPLDVNTFYYKDSSDFKLQNQMNVNFIFQRHVLTNGRIFSNNLDTIFTRKDIDFFREQILSLTKESSWKKPFVNAVLIDSVGYDQTDKHIFGKRALYGSWRYSLPLFSANKQYALIIKMNAVELSYFIYRLNNKHKWQLFRKFNQWAID